MVGVQCLVSSCATPRYPPAIRHPDQDGVIAAWHYPRASKLGFLVMSRNAGRIWETADQDDQYDCRKRWGAYYGMKHYFYATRRIFDVEAVVWKSTNIESRRDT